jgi:hypothetical protein
MELIAVLLAYVGFGNAQVETFVKICSLGSLNWWISLVQHIVIHRQVQNISDSYFNSSTHLFILDFPNVFKDLTQHRALGRFDCATVFCYKLSARSFPPLVKNPVFIELNSSSSK